MAAGTLREQIDCIDAVLYTHQHADHLNGIDDLRAYCFHPARRDSAVWQTPSRLNDIQQRFSRAFFPPSNYWDKPVLQAHLVEREFSVNGVTVTPIPVLHGQWPIYGYRVGNFAYITDVSEIPLASSWPLLEGLDIAARQPAPPRRTDPFQFRAGSRSRRAYRCATDLPDPHDARASHEAMCDALPGNIRPAHDGLKIVL